MQTLWWLHCKILRDIKKKTIFRFSEPFPAHLQTKSEKSAYKSKKNVFLQKFNMGIKKRRISRWFRIGWKRFEKMHQKMSLSKTWRKYALFSLLLMFVKLILHITFFGAFFNNFFNGFEISMKFCVLWHLFWFFKFFFVILVLFSNFEAKRAKNASKNKKMYLVNVS